MSDLTYVEKLKLEKLLEMDGGYVLDFSNRTFHEFILENTKININEDKYNRESGSKANRLRAFLSIENNYTIGKLISAFLDYWKLQKLINCLEASLSEKILFDECFQISERLIRDNACHDTIEDTIDVHFEKIQRNIIEQIELAKFTIWIAVAWFTDYKLFDRLVVKRKQGVNVQLIIIDDEINRKSGLNYENEFEVHRIKEIGIYKNIMHNKFCVLDMKTVIHGSYNWNKRANYNKEAITIVHSREVAEQFSHQFIKLKNSPKD